MTELLLLVGIPLAAAVAALGLLLPGASRWLPVAPWLPAAGLVLLGLSGDVVELPWLLLGTRLGVDAQAAPLVLLAVVVWSLAGWHARRTLPAAEQARFFSFWLLTWCGNLCVFITLDAASFFAAYAFMTLSAYGLVVHHGRTADFRAGRVYLWMAVLAEGALVGALLLLALEAGNVPLESAPAAVAAHGRADWIALLMLVGFGVKVGLAGLHMWLPLAHPQAPVPASAVLSGVILKAGLMGWLRFLPIAEPGYAWLGEGLFLLGFATAVFGVVVGVTQRAVKPLLAYSSVSQMGFLSMIVALALLEPGAAAAMLGLAVLFALHHGLAKATLFLGVDLIRDAPRLARRLLWLPAAALAGLPLTSGMLVKAALKANLPDTPAYLPLAVGAASAATTVLMIRLVMLARTETGTQRPGQPLPWLVSLTAVLALPWLWAYAQNPALAASAVRPAVVVDGLWPLLIGAAVGVLLERIVARRGVPGIPPGDLINLRLPWRLRLPRWRVRRPHRRAAGLTAPLEAGLQRLSAAALAGVIIVALMLWL